MSFMEFIIIVINVLIGIAAVYLIPTARQHLSAKQLATVKFWVSTAVSAIQQISKTTNITGADKKAYVMDFINKMGLKIGLPELDALIEDAVLKLKGGVK